jgi:hypothetical protein
MGELAWCMEIPINADMGEVYPKTREAQIV